MNFGDVIEKVRRRLLSGVREQTVQLTQAYTAGGDVLNIAGGFTGAIQAGAILSVDLEMMYVTGVTTTTVSVIGGYEGSTPANHALGALVYVNPRFSKFDISVAINDDLLDLSSPYNGLGQELYIDVTYNPVYQGYDLGSHFSATSSKVLEVSYKIAPPVRTFPLIRRGDYRVVRNQSDTAFPSGNGVILYRSAYPGLPVHIQFLSPFQPLVNVTDDLTTVAGLPPTCYDIPDLGAAIKLMQPREVKRNFIEAQPDPRKAAEVPPNAVANSSAKLEQQRQKRIDAEHDRISMAYPNAEFH